MIPSAALEAGITTLVAASAGLYSGDDATGRLRAFDNAASATTGLNPEQIAAVANATGGAGNAQSIYGHYAPSIDAQLGEVADCTIALSLMRLLGQYAQAELKTTELQAQAHKAGNVLEQINNKAEHTFGQVIDQAVAYLGNICQALGGVNPVQNPEGFSKVVQLGATAIDCTIDTLLAICQQRNDAIRGVGEQLLGLMAQTTTEIDDLIEPHKEAALGTVVLASVAAAGGLLCWANSIDTDNGEAVAAGEPEPQLQPEPEPQPEPSGQSPEAGQKGITKAGMDKPQTPVSTPATPKNEPVAADMAATYKAEPASPVTPSQPDTSAVPPVVEKQPPATTTNDTIKPKKAGTW